MSAKFTIKLRWELQKDGTEWHLKCGRAVCGKMVLMPDSHIKSVGCGIALWGKYEEGYDDFEYAGNPLEVKFHVESDACEFFRDCFGGKPIITLKAKKLAAAIAELPCC
jgi:hypothetical protein